VSGDRASGDRHDTRDLVDLVPLLLLPLVLVLIEVGHGIYAAQGLASPARLELFHHLGFVAVIWAWFASYVRRHRLSPPLDMGWFLAVAWWAIVPYYLIRVQGWRGVGAMAAFGAIYLAAWATGRLVSVILAR
jgi:hypothetical protein